MQNKNELLMVKAQAEAQLVFNRWNEKEDEYLILGYETSIELNSNEIIEIAVINLKGRTLFHSFVERDHSFSKKAVRSHEIQDTPTWTDVLDHLYPFMQEKAILIYNEAVDETAFPHHYGDFNKKYYTRNDEHKRTISNNCIMHTYADLIRSPRPVPLSEASGFSRKHGALSICLATLAVIKNNYDPHFTEVD